MVFFFFWYFINLVLCVLSPVWKINDIVNKRLYREPVSIAVEACKNNNYTQSTVKRSVNGPSQGLYFAQNYLHYQYTATALMEAGDMPQNL